MSRGNSRHIALAASTKRSYSADMTEPRKPTPEAPQAPPVSLKELSEAFAEAMGGRAAAPASGEGLQAEPTPPLQAESGQMPDEPPGAEKGDKSNLPRSGPEGASHKLDLSPFSAPPEAEDPCPVSPLTILEAMLFVGNPLNEPLTAARAAGLMRGVEPEEIAGLVEQLNRRYAANDCPYRILSEGPGWRMGLRGRFGPLRNRFYGRVREARLSQAAVDVLAIVAYRQPLTADEVSGLRDRPSGHLLAQLVRRQLLQVHRSEQNRRKLLYRTTDRFLELFGLENTDELPQAEDLEKR